jgi:hypothetical protein
MTTNDPSVYDIYTIYLRADDLPEDKLVPVTIARVTRADVWNPHMKIKEPTLVLWFVGKRRPLSLNNTRVNDILEITGTDNYTRWPGTKLRLARGVQSGKHTVIIKPFDASTPTPAATPPAATPPPPEPPPPPTESNPDPATDATWRAWLALAAQADELHVPRTSVIREQTTEGDLKANLSELGRMVLTAKDDLTSETEAEF